MKKISGTATFQATISLPIPGGAFAESESLAHVYKTYKQEALDILRGLLTQKGGSIIGEPIVKLHLSEGE